MTFDKWTTSRLITYSQVRGLSMPPKTVLSRTAISKAITLRDRLLILDSSLTDSLYWKIIWFLTLNMFSPQATSVYPPKIYGLFLIIVTVCGFPSQRVWNVFAAQPWEEARYHSFQCEREPATESNIWRRLKIKSYLWMMTDDIFESLEYIK